MGNALAHTVRIEELPAMTVISSTAEGLDPGASEIREFVAWAKTKGVMPAPGSRKAFFFRSERLKGYELIIEQPEGFSDTERYETTTFAGGLYAVVTTERDELMEVFGRTMAWITASDRYQLRHPNEVLGHIVTPDAIREKFDYEQQDLYFPIALKE